MLSRRNRETDKFYNNIHLRRRELIYAIVMLLAFLPVTAVKIFDIHSDARFHELYPDDEERAHREAAAAMDDCPFCHIQLSQFVAMPACVLPPVPCTTIHDYTHCVVSRVDLYPHCSYLRAPPVFS